MRPALAFGALPVGALPVRGGVVVCALVSGALASCGGVGQAPDDERRPSLSPVHYTLAVDDTLERLTETVCSEGPWTDRLVSIHAAARTRLVRARALGAGGERRALDVGEIGPLAIATRGLPPDVCVELVFDLASSGGGMDGCFRGPSVALCATSAWLVAAEPWRTSARHRVTLALPEGMSMSPALGEDERGLYLDERSFRYVGYAAFGALAAEEVEVPGGCARVVVPARSSLASSPHVVPWVSRAAHASSLVTGLAPEDVAITALPIPVVGERVPVVFGMAGRGTRPSVIALLAESPTAALETDWTLVHELSHLLVPYVPAEDAWLSEGIATYYQEVLRARAGMQSAEDAWRALDDGFRRGAQEAAHDSLREGSRRMREEHTYTRVYWAGAAIAFLLDVTLRERGLGSLDSRVSRLAGRRDETMRAEALVALLDDEDGVVREVVARWLDVAEFPDVTAAYEVLGLAREAPRTVVLTQASPLRDAIMNAGLDVASNGRCRAGNLPRVAHE